MVFHLNELSSASYRGQIVDEDGIGFGAIETLTLTLFDKVTQAIINSRDEQDVLNANGVSVDLSTGQLTWALIPADNVILDDTLRQEEHRARFTATWNGSNKQMQHEVTIKVVNLRRLP